MTSVAHAHASSFGAALRARRVARALSQERLAADAEVSARHLSFLETGRAAPSRQMVLVLASALDLPLRDRNALLAAAGFAPVYAESDLATPALRMLRRAIEHTLRAVEPYPAIVFDRDFRIRETNGGAARLLAWALDGRAPVPEAVGHALAILFDPRGLRPCVVNWEEVAAAVVNRAHHELARDPGGADRRAALDALLARTDVPERVRRAPLGDLALPFLPVHLRVRGQDARFFTAITTLGTPLDVTAQELSIETYYPADDETEAFVRLPRAVLRLSADRT